MLSQLNIKSPNYVYTDEDNCIDLTNACTSTTNWLKATKNYHVPADTFRYTNLEPFLGNYNRFEPIGLQIDEAVSCPNDESKVKSFMATILNNYFKPKIHNVSSEQKSGKGIIDY